MIAFPSLFGISIVLFAVPALAPGDPFGEPATNPNVPSEVRANLRVQFGMDDPGAALSESAGMISTGGCDGPRLASPPQLRGLPLNAAQVLPDAPPNPGTSAGQRITTGANARDRLASPRPNLLAV